MFLNFYALKLLNSEYMFEAIPFILTWLTVFIPGALVSYAFLKKTKFSQIEKWILSVLFSVHIVPIITILEFVFLGIKFSTNLVFINSILVLFGGIIWIIKEKYNVWKDFIGEFRGIGKSWKELTSKGTKWTSAVTKDWIFAILFILILLGAFYVRFATAWNTRFFEFDPYWYDEVTQTLITTGTLPTHSDIAYYPLTKSMRDYPMIHFMTGGWYTTYQFFAGIPYNKDLLILTAQLYPPLVALLAVFLAYLLFKEKYGRGIGLIAAGLFAFTPQLIEKLAAGVSEQQPYGIFAAMLIFAFYFIASERKDNKSLIMLAFAVFSASIGSRHYIWPFMILAALIILHHLLDFWHAKIDKKLVVVDGVVIATAIFANITKYLFHAHGVRGLTNAVLLLVAAYIPVLILYGLQIYHKKVKLTKAQIFGAAAVVGILILFLTPIGMLVVKYVNYSMGFAYAKTPLMMTVQEENPTSPRLFFGSYGYLSPFVFLFAALLIIAYPVLEEFYKKKNYYLLGIFGVLLIIPFIRTKLLEWFGAGLEGATDIGGQFIYFVFSNSSLLLTAIAIIFAIVNYWADRKKGRWMLYAALIIFPISFIGLNKLKYMLHLAFALTIAGAFVLGELIELMKKWTKNISFSKVFCYGIGFILIIGQLTLAGNVMKGLSYSRIDDDWMSTMGWIKANLAPTQERVSSWWDYGHWTTFFGETKTVLDPSNSYAILDMQMAHALVDGNTSELIHYMHIHNSSYIMLDADLIPKWGALVFQSGALAHKIPKWQKGTGKSKYEAEHYFEYLYYAGDCPNSITPLPAYKSSFGAYYCLAGNKLMLVGRGGLKPLNHSKIIALDRKGKELLNINPDLSYAGYNNTVYNAAFTRLFFEEKLPGFELVYKSPHGRVKIFKLTK